MQKRNFIAQRLGFWSAVLTTLMLVWFTIAFGLYQSILYAPWHGMQAYADTFQAAPFLAWLIPCFILTFSFLIMIVCLYTLASEENTVWGLLTLICAIAYTIILSTCYYIQMVVVEYNLVHHSTAGLTLWLFAPPYPHSIPGALEGIGYLFMSLSLIFASKLFSGDKLTKWIKWTLLFSGITGLVVFTDPLSPLPLIIAITDALANAMLLISSLILVSIWFYNSYSTTVYNPIIE